MIEKVLSSIGGIGVYGVISISIFFAFFTGMLVWAFCLKKSHIETMGALPLDGSSQPPDGSEHSSSNFDL